MSKEFNQSRPILLIGSGRSGTTFLAKLIDSHPDVLYRHEPDRVMPNTEIPFLPPDELSEPLISAAAAYLDQLLHTGTGTTSIHRPFFDKSYRSRPGDNVHRAAALAAALLEKLPGDLTVPVPDLVRRTSALPVRVLIKTVSSLWRTRLFSLARPEMQIVHLIRHPCAVVASRLRGIALGRMQQYVFLESIFEANRGQRFGMSLAELQSRSVEEQMAFAWMALNQQVYDDMLALPNYRMVVYEDLCLNLTEQTRQLFEFLGLDYNEQTKEFISAMQGMSNTRRYFSVKQAPKAALTKWHDELTSTQISAISNMVGQCAIGEQMLSVAVAS